MFDGYYVATPYTELYRTVDNWHWYWYLCLNCKLTLYTVQVQNSRHLVWFIYHMRKCAAGLPQVFDWLIENQFINWWRKYGSMDALASWLVDRLNKWLDSILSWLIELGLWLVVRLIVWLIKWLIKWLINWLINWFIDRLIKVVIKKEHNEEDDTDEDTTEQFTDTEGIVHQPYRVGATLVFWCTKRTG